VMRKLDLDLSILEKSGEAVKSYEPEAPMGKLTSSYGLSVGCQVKPYWRLTVPS
jgi:hypothetical protein